MTDQELIGLLEHKTPEELTPDEIELLRRKLSESPALRETLVAQLQMESYLNQALGRINLSPAEIVHQAAQYQQPAYNPLVVLGLLLLVPLLVVAGLWAYSVRSSRTETAENESVAPEVNKETHEKTGDRPRDAGSGTAQASDGPDDAAAVGKQAEASGSKSKTNEPATESGPSPAAADAAPWQAALDPAVEPLPYEQVAFDAPDLSSPAVRRGEIDGWFARVPGVGFRIGKTNTQYGKCGTIEGIGRLRSPWPEDGVLRLHLENFNRLKIHFFHQLAGASLVFYEDQNFRWAAYATTRDAGKPTPKFWAITATDDDRARRSEMRFGGPLDLSYREGEIILSRGDVVLLAAPLAGPPSEVYFDGRATIHGIELMRTSGAPKLPEPPRTVVTIDRPADLKWTASKPDLANLQPQGDGSLRVAADKLKERVELYTPLDSHGPQEVVLELADVSPGTGVYLGRENGKHHEVLRFYRDKKSGQLAARLHGWDDQWEADFDAPGDKPAPLAEPHCWVKLLFGCGNLRWWLSTDGVHWAQSDMAHDNVPPGMTSLGVQLVANRPDTHLTIKQIELRRLDGLASLANEGLVKRAPTIVAAPSPGTWLLEVLRQKPAEVETLDWLRACVVRSLGAGVHRDVAYPILEALLDDTTARPLAVEQQLAALDDALLLCWDLRDGQVLQRGILGRYIDLGLAASDRSNGETPAWSTVRPHYLAAPVQTWLQQPVDLDRVIRSELVHAAHAGDAQQSLDLARELRFFQLHRDRGLVEWLESLARRELPGSPAGELARLKDSWREPLIEELSKEAYNALTELQAVLESQAWDDAARLVTTLDAETAPGVAPYVNDKTLLTSLAVAIQLTLADYPQLRESLGDRFAALARLRIGQAMAAGDARAMELATVQFAGTDAAADAHQWLGDRALASGWFERAMAEYERAQRMDPSLSASLAPRRRLAAAMLGRDAFAPVEQQVKIGELSLSPAEFEGLVAEMRARGQLAGLNVATAPQDKVPSPTGFETHVRSRLDGPVGSNPSEEVGRRTNQYRVPWADRQIATFVEGDKLYVANRFQVAAYNLTDGKRLWQSEKPPGDMQRAQDWAMIAMRPLVTGDRIYVRMLYSANPQLVCLEKSSGKLLWTAESRERAYLVSDPLLVQGQLVALGIALEQDQQGVLEWCSFDPHTGELLRQRKLVRLRSTWGARSCCEVAPADGGLIAALGGITLSVDEIGDVRWVRTHVTLPADEDPKWLLQMYQRPLVAGEQVYVAQPGVRTVECLASQTGRRQWASVLPEVVGVVGLSGDRLIVRTESGMRALDAGDGSTLWRFAVDDLHSFQLVDDERLLIAGRERHPTKGDQWQTRFIWLDPATGQPLATALAPNLDDNDPRLGPLVPYKDRLFTFFGRGQHNPERDIVELVPKGEAERTRQSEPIDPWLARVPTPVSSAAINLLSDWRLLSGQGGDRTGRLDEAHGERNVLGVRSTGVWPVILAREVTLPKQGKPRLRLRLGNDSGQNWKIEVAHGSEVLATHEVTDAAFPDRWKTLEIDLSRAAGHAGWLIIKAQATNGDHVLYLRSAELVF